MSLVALPERIREKIDVNAETGCWEWRTARARNTYGSVRIGGWVGKAHRAVYELLVDPIPDGLELDHLCRVRYCVNPDHLEPVTQWENYKRARAAYLCTLRSVASDDDRTSVGIREFRGNLAHWLDRANHEPVTITRDGLPHAVIGPVTDQKETDG